MTKYNTLNVKLSNSQLHKLKPEIKNGTEVTLNLSSNLIGSLSWFKIVYQLIQNFQKSNVSNCTIAEIYTWYY